MLPNRHPAFLAHRTMGSFCSYCDTWGKCESDGLRQAWMPRLRTAIGPYAVLCGACVATGAPHGRYLHRILTKPLVVCSIIAAYAYPVYAIAITRVAPIRTIDDYLPIDT